MFSFLFLYLWPGYYSVTDLVVSVYGCCAKGALWVMQAADAGVCI